MAYSIGSPLNLMSLVPDFRLEGLKEAQTFATTQQGIAQGIDNQRAIRQDARQQEFYKAINETPPEQIASLRRKFPEFTQAIQQELGIQSAEHSAFVNSALNKISIAASTGNPNEIANALNSNSAALSSLGVSKDDAWQLYQQDPGRFNSLLNASRLATLPMDKQFDVQHKRDQLNEQIRSNQAGEALQARGQNLSYQSAMTGHGLAAERLALDKQKFGFEVQQAQKKAEELINAAPKLSVNMEKAIEKSAGDAAASRNAADSMTTLADTLEKEKPTPGLFGNAENMFSKLTGQNNYLRDMRIRFNQLANAQATKLLPPGPASDKDIEFARKGIPSETDNPMVMARWLRGMAKMESNNAKFNEFKSEWMSANGSPGQSDRNRNIMGMDVKKGESLNSAAKRFLSSSYGDSQPQQQLSDDELISKYLGGQ
ncbi:acyltransferase [Escherichia coli]|uniref:phage DNA ejection protein n=2 Tax=Escherichia coli TaxID=562 RepID=UPI000BAF6D2B|nr:phage DNA ejection protein [Escherichia coli]EEB0653718.1 acyltransferase [Salmonella enterica subsp. enterica serovar Kentucky]EEQ7415223.1 acyltransferase [Escherichia coli]EEV0203402.1 acyltransferase [Escherichia coli]EEV6650051.1 acyltransferase [Escherichia coli]EEX3886312.1 acyltransferase [Escherichia coli]